MHQTFSSIRKKMELLGVCLLFSYSHAGFALTEAQATEKLKQLIQSKQYAEAFAFSSEVMIDYGGEPAFDFYTGIAALQVGEYQQAVFAFERTVIVKPQWQRARLNLAKGYYFIDNLVASRRELEILIAETKEASLRTAASDFLVRVNQGLLDKKRIVRQQVGVSFGHDSNINSGSTIDEIDSPLLNQPILLDDTAKEISDGVVKLNYQLRYQTPLTQQSLLIGDAALYHTDYVSSENGVFESTVAQFAGKYQDVWGDSTYQVGLYIRPLLLDGDMYRNQYGVNTNLTIPFNKKLSLSWELGFGETNYLDVDSLDATDAYTNLNLQYSSGHWRHMLGGNFTDVDPKHPNNDHNAYNFFILQYQGSYVLSLSQQLTFSLQYQKWDHDSLHPFFLRVRDDELRRINLGWRYLVEDWLMVQVNYKFQEKDSKKLPIYEYQQNEILLGVVMQF